MPAKGCVLVCSVVLGGTSLKMPAVIRKVNRKDERLLSACLPLFDTKDQALIKPSLTLCPLW